MTDIFSFNINIINDNHKHVLTAIWHGLTTSLHFTLLDIILMYNRIQLRHKGLSVSLDLCLRVLNVGQLNWDFLKLLYEWLEFIIQMLLPTFDLLQTEGEFTVQLFQLRLRVLGVLEKKLWLLPFIIWINMLPHLCLPLMSLFDWNVYANREHQLSRKPLIVAARAQIPVAIAVDQWSALPPHRRQVNRYCDCDLLAVFDLSSWDFWKHHHHSLPYHCHHSRQHFVHLPVFPI